MLRKAAALKRICGRCAPQNALTDEQIKELEEILEKSRERGTESTDKEGEPHA